MGTQTEMAKATILSSWHNGAEDRTYNEEDLKSLTFDERDGGVMVEDDESTVRVFFKNGNEGFMINGRTVFAFFDVQDFRPDGFEGLGAVQVRVALTIDGKDGYQLLLQNDNNTTLDLADREASQETLNGDVWRALGGEANDAGEVSRDDWQDFVDTLGPVIAAAQAEFDAYIARA